MELDRMERFLIFGFPILALMDTTSTVWVASLGFDPLVYENGIAARFFISLNLFWLWVGVQPAVFLAAGLLTFKAKRNLLHSGSKSRHSEIERAAIIIGILFVISIPIFTIVSNLTFPLRVENQFVSVIFPSIGFGSILAVLAHYTLKSFKP